MKKIVYILLLLTISLSIINVNAMELPTERWTNKYSKYSGSQMTGHFSDYMYDINSNKGALSENIYNYNSNIIVVDSSIGREKPVDEQDNYSERIIKSYSSRNKKNWEKEYTLNSFQFYKNYLFALNKYNSVVDCIDLQTGEAKFHISVDTAYTTTPEKIFVNDNYIFLVYTSGRNLYVDKVKYNGQIVSNNYYNLEDIYPSDLLSDYDENKVMSFNNNKILVADKNTIITMTHHIVEGLGNVFILFLAMEYGKDKK